MALRLPLIVFGAVAGLCLWALVYVVPDLVDRRVLLFLTTTAGAFFGIALAMTGPISLVRAMLGAGAVALPLGGLMVLGSWAYADTDAFLSAEFGIGACGVLLTLPMPFLIARMRTGGFACPELFFQAWSPFGAAGVWRGVVVRVAGACARNLEPVW